MSLETGVIEELRTKSVVDLSDADIPLNLATVAEHLDIEEPEPEEHETEFAAETTSADLTQPDSVVNEKDAGSPSTLGAVLERLEIKITEESETEFEADFTKDLIHIILGFNDAESPSDTVREPEQLENGECEEPKSEEPAADVTIADLDVSDSLTESDDAVALSYRDAVLEHLENGECEEPKTEEPAAEVSIADLNVPDSLTDSDDTIYFSYRDAVLEHLGNGECGERKTKEPAADVAIADLNVSDSFTDSDDTIALSYRDAVLEHLENGEREEPKVEEPAAEVASADLDEPHALIESGDAVNLSDLAKVTDGSAIQSTVEATKREDHVEELVDDTGFGDATEVSPLPSEEVVQDGADKVQVTSENAIEKNEFEFESILESTDESEADLPPNLEGATEQISSSKQLPLEVGKHVIQLQCESSAPDAPNGVCLLNIIGTAHVSKASCEEVQALIKHVKPEVVFLELCSSRTNVLLPSKREVPTFSSMIESYKKKQMNLFGLMYSYFLAKVGEKLEVVPGTEFRVAYEEAVRCGASVTLGDRPIQITLKRTWGRMGIWHRTKFLCSMLTASFIMPTAEEFQALMEKMGQSDELTIMIQELSKDFPSLLETLVVERDLYMVASLRTVARRYSSVVAVVGRGHLSGIASHWKEDINVDELLTIPPKNPLSRMWLWGTVALGVGGIVVGVNLLRRR